MEAGMINTFHRFAKDESGATAIEYGLIAALISVVCIATWRTIGVSMRTRFTQVNAGLN
jgi:pilus assembly protein Flp/PilA